MVQSFFHAFTNISRRYLTVGKASDFMIMKWPNEILNKAKSVFSFLQRKTIKNRWILCNVMAHIRFHYRLPTIPAETVTNNTVLSNIKSSADWPSLSTSSPKEFYEGTIRLLFDYGATVQAHMEHLKQRKSCKNRHILRLHYSVKEEELTFTTVVEPILNEESVVQYAFSTLLLKMYTDWPMSNKNEYLTDLYNAKHMYGRELHAKFFYDEFQDAVKSLYSKRSVLNTWQFRLLEIYLLEIKALGLDVRNRKKKRILSSWISSITRYRISYFVSIMCTNEQNVFNVTDRKKLSDAPNHILKLLAVDPHDVESGPWRAYMSPKTLLPLMQYCSDREIRKLAWSKWTSRASFEHDFYNNSINIEEIRHNNEGFVKALNYASVAEHRIENKMAGTPEVVRIFLNVLKKRIRPVFVDRMEAWTTYANEREGILTDLQPFDLFYVCRKEAFAYYNVNSLDVSNYFPFWATFENLIHILCYIFGLRFEDVSESKLERCHPEVRIYSIDDQHTGIHYGRLYVDPFERPNKRKGWTTLLGRMQSEQDRLDKLVYLIADADAPKSEQPSFLHYSQLQQLLYNTGRALQLLLSQSPYQEICIPWEPNYATDWDASELLPFFTQFFIYRPNMLSVLASPHKDTGEVLSEELSNNISLSLARGTLWETYRALFWADYDLTIFSMEDRSLVIHCIIPLTRLLECDCRKKFWLDVYREMYKDYFPFQRDRSDYHPCSFTPIFGSPLYMSSYYRKLWVE
uniref:Peptidase_M3 domain-containing protein n=1 Tax=Syphacia muris TaxID=451379 RepID=A0A0N5AMI6_9BILA